MTTHDSKRTKRPDRPVEEKVVEEVTAEETAEGNTNSEEAPKKKSTYNKEAAKKRRDQIMEYAKAGGYVPKERTPGSGNTEKRTSKKGTTYYYTPWGSLTPEQKATRLAQARDRTARDRDDAKKYREEHGITTDKKSQKEE